MTDIVVLGGGTGGTLAANRLRTRYAPDGVTITVVDQDDRHVYQPGGLVVNVVDLPIKCPVAPLEFCFLADWYGALTKPVAAAQLAGMLAAKGIGLVTEFDTGVVDDDGRRLVGEFYDIAAGGHIIFT